MKLIKKMHFVILILFCLKLNAQGKDNNWNSNRPDGYAPISLSANYLQKGSWLFSYGFNVTAYKGLLWGSKSITNKIAHSTGYPITPLKMSKEMDKFNVMYTLTDKIIISTMFNYEKNYMDSQIGQYYYGHDEPYTNISTGLGDIKVGLIYKLLDKNKQLLNSSITFSLPTGSINKKGHPVLNLPGENLLPYQMQIGSGTFDTNFRLTYMAQNESISFGSELGTTIHFGKNSDDYAFNLFYYLWYRPFDRCLFY